MTNTAKPTFREQVRAIIKAHDEATAEFAAVEHHAHDISTPMRAIIDSWDQVHEANQRAIAAMRTANRAALDLLNTLDVQ